MRLHREGRATLWVVGITLLILNGLLAFLWPNEIVQMVLGVASVLFFGFFIQFFRHPHPEVPQNPDHVLSPAEGKVVVIEEVEETEFLKQRCRQLSIFMSPFNVHVNRNPVSGIVEYVKYHPGKYLVAWHPKSSTENERTTISIRHEKHGSILFRQIAGAVARRICYYVEEGQNVGQGREMGFIKFGSRVDVFVPLEADIKVKIGENVRCAETVLAKL